MTWVLVCWIMHGKAIIALCLPMDRLALEKHILWWEMVPIKVRLTFIVLDFEVTDVCSLVSLSMIWSVSYPTIRIYLYRRCSSSGM